MGIGGRALARALRVPLLHQAAGSCLMSDFNWRVQRVGATRLLLVRIASMPSKIA